MLPVGVYGFAKTDDVEKAIFKRQQDTRPDSKEATAALLGEAVAALLDINSSIPEHSRHRHLIAGALENFANGPTKTHAHTEA